MYTSKPFTEDFSSAFEAINPKCPTATVGDILNQTWVLKYFVASQFNFNFDKIFNALLHGGNVLLK